MNYAQNFIIQEITKLDGTPRTDDRYPQRKGCLVKIIGKVQPGIPLFLSYLADADGNPKDGMLVTSNVDRVGSLYDDQHIEACIMTLNSVYHLKGTECVQTM